MSEWQSGYQAGQFEAMKDVALELIKNIYSPYNTVRERHLYMRLLRNLEMKLPDEDDQSE